MKMDDERKDFLQKLRLAASEADDLLTSCDASDLLDGLEVSRDFMFEAACMIEQLESHIVEMDSDLSAWADVASSPGAVEDMARENYRLTERLAQVERERDAAVKDCSRFPCATCSDKENGDLCHNCNVCKDTRRTNYEWRGVCPENSKEEAK